MDLLDELNEKVLIKIAVELEVVTVSKIIAEFGLTEGDARHLMNRLVLEARVPLRMFSRVMVETEGGGRRKVAIVEHGKEDDVQGIAGKTVGDRWKVLSSTLFAVCSVNVQASASDMSFS
ncbi:hypothetical protein NDN08_003078 [Rhodosorus marinus]|uniref:Uncharacterized protein n=1 Tax=Rhodosorus marinus TaxID=101924 RepID=A0AAV8UVH8_9RHOD|nr:hypothetical protein NDN08_003078 [Rhodosorus marinus]